LSNSSKRFFKREKIVFETFAKQKLSHRFRSFKVILHAFGHFSAFFPSQSLLVCSHFLGPFNQTLCAKQRDCGAWPLTQKLPINFTKKIWNVENLIYINEIDPSSQFHHYAAFVQYSCTIKLQSQSVISEKLRKALL